MADDPVATAASNNPALSPLVTAVEETGLVDTLTPRSSEQGPAGKASSPLTTSATSHSPASCTRSWRSDGARRRQQLRGHVLTDIRGGLSTKIHLACDGPGRPLTRPLRVVGDKGYSSRKIRSYLRRRGIARTIPERVDQINGRIRRGESLCRLDREVYRRRNVVERCFNRLKQTKPSPPATTNEPATTKPWSPSPACGYGSPAALRTPPRLPRRSGLPRCSAALTMPLQLTSSPAHGLAASAASRAAVQPSYPVRTTAWSPCGPNRCRISTAVLPAGPNQWGSAVSNSATSPGRRVVSEPPRIRRSSPART